MKEKLPRGYPRKTVRIDGVQFLRKPIALCERARIDQVLILRCGRPTHAIIHAAYFAMLRRVAGDKGRAGASKGTRRRQFRRNTNA